MGDVDETTCIVVDRHIVEAVQVMRELRVDGDVGYVKDPDVGHTHNLH